MDIKVKVCGITSVDDAKKAIDCGASAIGLNFNQDSKHLISLYKAKQIIKLSDKIKWVGMFDESNMDFIQKIIDETQLDIIQIEQKAYPEFCSPYFGVVVKSIIGDKRDSMKVMLDFHVGYLMMDNVSGYRFLSNFSSLWEFSKEVSKYGMVILSSGINHLNVSEAINRVKPYCVDVCDCLEDEVGKMNITKMQRFFKSMEDLK
ncbi:MAG: phosphoribosylanthranilate isomerase [Pseudomonadota bacterium]